MSLSAAAAFVATEPDSVLASVSQSLTGESDVPPAYRGKHEIVALPFDPKSLRGISEKLIVSHHGNNYSGAVRNLNKVEAALATVTKDTPQFVVSGLKERELMFSNSITLHQLYFSNLGGKERVSGEIGKAISEAYGSASRWEEEFRTTGSSLGGGSGWVILDCEIATKELRTHWSGNHTQSRAGTVPILVMDMYEHAYQMDYGAAAGKYIDAFFDNIRWEEVGLRFSRAIKVHLAMKA